jgi:large subunit ribosomal protein L15
VTVETLIDKGLIKNSRTDVKILGQGDLKKKLTVTAHSFSASAREKIEQAGGTATALREPVEKKKRTRKAKPASAQEPEPDEAPEVVDEAEAPTDADETPDQENT